MKHADSKVFLHPGELCFASDGEHLHTLLGSCVSITLWHPRLRVGGMCHFVLPSRPVGSTSRRPDGRYGDEAVELFERAAEERHSALPDYQVKVFGGGNMLGDQAGSPEDLVGTRNAEAAIKLLMARGVELAVADARGAHSAHGVI